jgi:hypothetical protein
MQEWPPEMAEMAPEMAEITENGGKQDAKGGTMDGGPKMAEMAENGENGRKWQKSPHHRERRISVGLSGSEAAKQRRDKMVKHWWSSTGQTLVKHRPNTHLSVSGKPPGVNHWSNTGQTLVKHW